VQHAARDDRQGGDRREDSGPVADQLAQPTAR